MFDQFTDLSDRVTEKLDDGGSVDVIYLDFAKTFVKVPHQRLLQKLEGYGFRGGCYHG